MTSAMLQKPWSAQLPLRFAGTRMAISWNSFDRRGDRSFSRFWDGGCSMERTRSRILKGLWDHNQWNTAKSSIWFLFIIDFGHFGQPVIVSGHGSNQPATNKDAHEMDCAGPQIWKDGKISRWRSMWEHLHDHLIELDAVHVAKCTLRGEIHLEIIIDPTIVCSISFRFFQIMQKMTCHEDLCLSISKYPQPACAPSPPTSLSPSARPSHFASKGGRTLRAARWMNFQSLLPIRPSCHELGNLNTRKTTNVEILDNT